MNLISLLSQILGEYQQFNNGEHYFNCPFCHNHKRRFAVNININKWHCWHCGARGGSIITLFKKLDVSKSQLKELRELLSDEQIRNYIEPTDTNTNLYLPPEYKPLWTSSNNMVYRRAISYLTARGITSYDIVRYQMGYATEGPYANRVIIPSFDRDNKLNYYIARSLYDGGMKYKNPPVSKNVVMLENQINWKEPIILCEGIFDAIAIRRNAIPLLGKFIPKKLLKAMVKHKVVDVSVVLDTDAMTEAMEIERNLSLYGMNTKLVTLDKKDPSELGFDNVWSCIDAGQSTTFKDYIQGRLQII